MKMEVIEVNRKVLGVVFALSIVILVAALAPAFGHQPQNPKKEYIYASGGSIVLNLPEGGKCNKTDIKFTIMNVDKRSTKGAEDYIQVDLWLPTQSRFMTVAVINDNPVALTSLKTMLSGLPFIQYIQVTNDELQVWKMDDKIIANLTKSVDIIFGNLDGTPYASFKALNFTLPAMTLTLVKTASVYDIKEETTSYSAWPGASNWIVETKRWVAPGFAEVLIPSWLGTSPIPVTAFYSERIDMVAIKP